jgi:hypothetical protein
MHSDSRQPEDRHWTTGLAAAIVCGLLLIGAFVFQTATLSMPPSERWAAWTTFTLLALAYTLQGSPGLYDALGRAIRADRRALASLAALLPVLYLAYSLAVREFSWRGLSEALIFAALPALGLSRSAGLRLPTLVDAIVLIYVGLSLELGLLPGLTLPQQDGLVGFFAFGVVPFLLLLLAARGWPGLGFNWYLSSKDLRKTLAATVVGLIVLAPIAVGLGVLDRSWQNPGAVRLFLAVLNTYFFVALPSEILLRGVLQNGVNRTLQARRVDAAPWLALGLAVLVSVLVGLNADPGGWRSALLAGPAAVASGWVYWRTGKVTASAVPHTLVVWLISVMSI